MNHQHTNSIELTDIVSLIEKRFESGWFPRDLVQYMEAHHHANARAIVIDAIALSRQHWHPQASPVWSEHADHLNAIVWWDTDRDYWRQLGARVGALQRRLDGEARFVEALLSALPAEPQFAPPPWLSVDKAAAAPGNDRILTKVRGLLAKAESTTFPDEAEMLSAKAQELIARHSIDLALLAETSDVPGGRRVYIESPYTTPKFLLLASVASANGCEAIWSKGRKTATVIGHDADLNLTDLLFTSLLVQGTTAVLAAGSQNAHGQSRTRSWRNSFWTGYAHRIGERLREATHQAQEQAAATSEALLPVLARRSAAVDQAVTAAFPRLSSLRVSSSNYDGQQAGRRFANRAALNTESLARPRGSLSA